MTITMKRMPDGTASVQFNAETDEEQTLLAKAIKNSVRQGVVDPVAVCKELEALGFVDDQGGES